MNSSIDIRALNEQIGIESGFLDELTAGMGRTIVGQKHLVDSLLVGLLSGGHILLEGVPGLAKTLAIKTLAALVDAQFSRVQFTPDVMPSDVTGFSIFNQQSNQFEFRPGGVMSNLVLADEINRANAKTQSALLEAMEERQVTVDSVTHKLQEPFMVLATQNPIEQHGTYPLPEAQLDRFLIKISMGYPLLDEEVRVVLDTKAAKAAIRPVASAQDVLKLRQAAESVYIDEQLARYAVQICAATRTAKECACGASPRGSIALVSIARANALMRGRSYVIPDDIKYLAPYVLSHRIILTHEAKIDGLDPRAVIKRIVESIALPQTGLERA